VKRNRRARRVKVSANGTGVVSHAGVALLREMAEETGLVDGVTAALIDTYSGVPLHAPGRVFTDLAVAIADGADAVSGIAVLGDREELFGPVASLPTTWRVLDRVDEPHLRRVRAARARGRWRGRPVPGRTSPTPTPSWSSTSTRQLPLRTHLRLAQVSEVGNRLSRGEVGRFGVSWSSRLISGP
jgi:hypothetical protein